MKIEQVDREAAAELYLALDGDEVTPSIVAEAARHRRGDYDLFPAVLAFARHRIQAREQAMNDAMTALKSVQYSPAPYTDGVKAIRDRFLQPGDVV